jgi:hypothetical protein
MDLFTMKLEFLQYTHDRLKMDTESNSTLKKKTNYIIIIFLDINWGKVGWDMCND